MSGPGRRRTRTAGRSLREGIARLWVATLLVGVAALAAAEEPQDAPPGGASPARRVAPDAIHGGQLLVLPASWIPRGYLRPDDPPGVDPFHFTSGSDLRAKIDRYLREVLAVRGRIELAEIRDLPKGVVDSLAWIADTRTGRHRLVPLAEGDRMRAFATILDVAATGGRRVRREGRTEYYSRAVIVLDESEGAGGELTEEDLAALDRFSRGGALIPCVEVAVLPLSGIEELARGEGIDRFVARRGLEIESPLPLQRYPTRFDALVARRALEKRLTDAMFRDHLLSRRRARRLLGTLIVGERRLRIVYPLPGDPEWKNRDGEEAFDPFARRIADLVGLPAPDPSPAYTLAVFLESETDGARRYRVEMTVASGHPGGPLVGALPERLDAEGIEVRVEYRPPGGGAFRANDSALAGSRFVPEGIGYRVEKIRGEMVLTVESVPAGSHVFRVTVGR